MVEQTDNQAEGPTAVAPGTGLDRSGLDQTVQLDAAIANGVLSLPYEFGRYRVTDRIGIGGFASVYEALDPDLDSYVAIKVLAENHSANAVVRKRFVAEARVARRLGSDRLIGVFDVGETEDGRPFVVMELAERGTLRQRLVNTGRPSPADLLRLIDELAACMSAVHDQGVVHRDIKPSNLLYRVTNPSDDHEPTALFHDDERLVLGDLGLARDISNGASSLTLGGGTEGYMAPEQADPRGKPDYRADIYSATVVLAELTTGRHPQRLDLPSADISTDVLEALMLSLSIDRENRPPTASVWRERLAAAYRHQHNSAEHDAITAAFTTAHLNPTKIQPLRYDTTSTPSTATEIPAASSAEPQPVIGQPNADHAPTPPPSLPVDPSRQPPPPQRWQPQNSHAPPSHPDPTPAPHQQPFQQTSAAQTPAAQAEAFPPFGPGQAPQAPALDGLAGHTPVSAPHPPLIVPAAQHVQPVDRQPMQPAPPGRPAPSPAHAQPGIGVPQQIRSGRAAGAETTPAPPPPGVSSPRTPTPNRQDPAVRPATRPGSAVSRAPGAVIVAEPPPARRKPSRRKRRKAAAVAAPPPTAIPVPATPPGTVQPSNPGQAPERRSKKDLKTARKWAELERKQNRQLARKARRRRRRLRAVNLVLSLIRGALAAIVAWMIGMVIVAARLGESLSDVGEEVADRPGAQALLMGGMLISFFWGLAYFPFPRSYEV